VVLFFLFQAEDGIRDATVTGVQTCALPISLLKDTVLTSLRSPSSTRSDKSRSISFGFRRILLAIPSTVSVDSGFSWKNIRSSAFVSEPISFSIRSAFGGPLSTRPLPLLSRGGTLRSRIVANGSCQVGSGSGLKRILHV